MMSDNAEGLFLIWSAMLSGPTLVRKSDHKDASQLAKGLVGCCSGYLERYVSQVFDDLVIIGLREDTPACCSLS
jgi:hypothetical protein